MYLDWVSRLLPFLAASSFALQVCPPQTESLAWSSQQEKMVGCGDYYHPGLLLDCLLHFLCLQVLLSTESLVVVQALVEDRVEIVRNYLEHLVRDTKEKDEHSFEDSDEQCQSARDIPLDVGVVSVQIVVDAEGWTREDLVSTCGRGFQDPILWVDQDRWRTSVASH